MQSIARALFDNRKKILVWGAFFALGLVLLSVPSHILAQDSEVQVDARGIPLLSFGDLLTFIIRMFFFIAGLAALIYGLWGALSWITSGGGADEVKAARDKIQAAILGVFILIIVLSLIVALEQVVFSRQLCFGLSCPVRLPGLKIFPLDCTSVDDCCDKMDFAAGTTPAGSNSCGVGDPRNPARATCATAGATKITVPIGVAMCNGPTTGTPPTGGEGGVICCMPRP